MPTLSEQQHICQTPLCHTDPLHILPEEQRQQFTQYGQGPIEALPYHCLHHALADKVAQQGVAIAVVDLQQSFTYQRIDDYANKLANDLHTLGVAPGVSSCMQNWTTFDKNCMEN